MLPVPRKCQNGVDDSVSVDGVKVDQCDRPDLTLQNPHLRLFGKEAAF